MNKAELVEELAKRTGLSKADANRAFGQTLNVISDAVADGDRVTLPGFGTFEKRERPARTARNPQTGEPIKIKKTNAPAFKAGAGLKKYVAASKKDQAAMRKERDA
ncbi:HU family DNA-binding protein [Nocardioides panacisoli]|nr:HU family DNA-binding protein [Nocardioides panacisoli]QYJ05706.1 HU family DNA-binding protein [Nocardioides panacisoli]